MSDDHALISQFLSHKEVSQGRSAGTVGTYRHRLSTLAAFLQARGKGLASADSEDLVEFGGMYLHQNGVAPRSRRPAIAAIRGFYRWLKRSGLIEDDPATRLEYPKIGRKLPHVLPAQYAEALFMQPDLETLRGLRDAAILGVLLGAGIRVSGLVGLNQEDLAVDRDQESGADIVSIRVTEKGGHDRLVPLPVESHLMIRAYLGHPDLAKIDRTLPDGKTVLFVSTQNRMVSPADYYGAARRLRTGSIRRMILRYGLQAKVPREYLHPHSFRHLFGTELAEGGIDVHLRQALMGHTSIESTLLYDKLSMRRLNAAVIKANPLVRIRTPVSGLVDELRKRKVPGV